MGKPQVLTPNNKEFYRLPAIAHVSDAFNKWDILCNANYVATNSEIGEPNPFMLILWQEHHPKSKYMCFGELWWGQVTDFPPKPKWSVCGILILSGSSKLVTFYIIFSCLYTSLTRYLFPTFFMFTDEIWERLAGALESCFSAESFRKPTI